MLDREAITNTLVYVSSTYLNWKDLVVGGSSAAVLRQELDFANDIDIIQHKGDQFFLHGSCEKRIWSLYYPEEKIDWHYSNNLKMNQYAKCFHKIIPALIYVDFKHNIEINGWKVITKYGAGLVNWLHHFLDYGFCREKTISPDADDEKELRKILDNDTYSMLEWKVEQERTLFGV